ncbi:hypothetical protein RJD38_19250 [Vibrio scophthalmi]|uniref:Uncharacterized protein n=2 Tax=Vibrio scophthalmi TaxID=45658 RepID=A0A1B1NVB5_9VIBR|nr:MULTISPECIES: hypothetical protein [Vibrio]ANS87667.1 hypothetical protein VSVS12_03967 [Vibrio scophthalmi]ANU38346.1 hypothetical protein VSVS05_03308 [Vibrio scophthalmi]EGU37466.1 hypothetical protein VIBRN418_04113 [Vibrio sp. N418]EGU41849.1 hypothetical protein VIS19158_10599 [Vibrio scophthalmi LMG 19158]ODS04659.1 hypothetical protein VSF3289_03798 [Vibrio scophthalmi]
MFSTLAQQFAAYSQMLFGALSCLAKSTTTLATSTISVVVLVIIN